MFRWDVDEEIFSLSITVIVEDLQHVGHLSTKTES